MDVSTGPVRYRCSGSCALIQTKWPLVVGSVSGINQHRRLVSSRFKPTVKFHAPIPQKASQFVDAADTHCLLHIKFSSFLPPLERISPSSLWEPNL